VPRKTSKVVTKKSKDSIIRPAVSKVKNRLSGVDVSEDADDLFGIGLSRTFTRAQAKRVKDRLRRKQPIVDWVRSNAAHGVTLSYLKSQLEIPGPARARQILGEVFPERFLVETKIPGDIHFLPVQSSVRDVEWISDVTRIQKKCFAYHVNSDANYMICRFEDRLRGNELRIYHLTDVHVGSCFFRKELFQKVINEILADPCAFALLGGDMMEIITKASVADPSEQYLNNNEQVVEFIKMVMPIAHKILGYSWGNHDGGRTEKAAEVDLARIAAAMLQVPYFRTRATIDIYWRGVRRTLSLTHRYGHSAFSIAQIERKVREIMGYSPYEIHAFLSGHTHNSFVLPIDISALAPGVGFVTKRIYIGNGGSFTRQIGSYTEKAGYAPTPQDMLVYRFTDKGVDKLEQYPILFA